MSTFKVQLLLGLGTNMTLLATIPALSNSFLVSLVMNNTDHTILICSHQTFSKHVHEDCVIIGLSLDLVLLILHEPLHIVNLGHLRSNFMLSLRL